MNSSTASQANFKNYVLVTLTYWGFTITDGALRLLVLLYFNNIGYTPIQIASLFLFYEVFGVVTNFLGGWIGSQLGLKVTLYTGISLQIFSLIMLSFLNPEWAQWLAVLYVMIAQAFSFYRQCFTRTMWLCKFPLDYGRMLISASVHGFISAQGHGQNQSKS